MSIKKPTLIISLIALSLSLMLDTALSTENEAETLDARQKFDSMSIKDLSEKDKQQLWNGHSVDENTPLIRRSITAYTQQYQKHKILIGSGHKGQHGGGRFGFGNDLSWYAIDTGAEHEPDALLNVFNPEHLKYFGKNFADEIYVDWPVLVTEDYESKENGIVPGNIKDLLAILKPGGALYFKRNGVDDSRKPSIIIAYANNNFISESGRYGYPLTRNNFEVVERWRQSGYLRPEERKQAESIQGPTASDEEIISQFKEDVLKKAREHYAKLGFSNVEFYGSNADGFKLTKSKMSQDLLVKPGQKIPQHAVEASSPKSPAQDASDSTHCRVIDEPVNFYKEAVFHDIFRKSQLHFDETTVHGPYNDELSRILYQSASKLMNLWKEKGQLNPDLVAELESNNKRQASGIVAFQEKIKVLEEERDILLNQYKELDKPGLENDEAKNSCLKEINQKKRQILTYKQSIAYNQRDISYNNQKLRGFYTSSSDVFFPDFSNVSYKTLSEFKILCEQLYVDINSNLAGCERYKENVMTKAERQVTEAGTQDLIAKVKSAIDGIGEKAIIDILTFANNGSYEEIINSGVRTELGTVPKH